MWLALLLVGGLPACDSSIDPSVASPDADASEQGGGSTGPGRVSDAGIAPPSTGDGVLPCQVQSDGLRCAEEEAACHVEPLCCAAAGRCCAASSTAIELPLEACKDGWAAPGCDLQPFGSPAPAIQEAPSGPIAFVPGGGPREGSGLIWDTAPLQVGPQAHVLTITWKPGDCGGSGPCPLVAGVLLLADPPPAQPRLEEAALALLLRADGELRLLGPSGPVATGKIPSEMSPVVVRLTIDPTGELSWTFASAGDGSLDPIELRLPASRYTLALYGRNTQRTDISAPHIESLSVRSADCDAPTGWGATQPIATSLPPGTRLDTAEAPDGGAVLAELLPPATAEEEGSLLVLKRLGTSLDASPSELGRLQLMERWGDVALLTGPEGWVLWGLDADGTRAWRRNAADVPSLEAAEPLAVSLPGIPDTQRVQRLAATGPAGSEWLLGLLGPPSGAGATHLALWKWDVAEHVLQSAGSSPTMPLSALGLPSVLEDLEVLHTSEAAPWRLWAVAPTGSRTELLAYVSPKGFQSRTVGTFDGSSFFKGVLPTGLRWRADEVHAGTIRLLSPAAWRSPGEEGGLDTLWLLMLGFDGRDEMELIRSRPLPTTASWWSSEGGS